MSAAPLSSIERRAVRVFRAINERPWPKTVQRLFLEHIGATWVSAVTSNRRSVQGLENLHVVRPTGGVLLCANHRSFFDLYVVAAVMWKARLSWNRRHYYPVRSTFFYESWAGVGVNLAVGGGSMYPPIFRDPGKSEHTRESVNRVVELLREPGVVVGVHPEGTRGKGADPHQLLKAQPGVGQMALQSGATVLPVWISGLGNDLARQVINNFRNGGRDCETVNIRFGLPVDLSAFAKERARVTVYKRAADAILEDIRQLGEGVRTMDA